MIMANGKRSWKYYSAVDADCGVATVPYNRRILRYFLFLITFELWREIDGLFARANPSRRKMIENEWIEYSTVEIWT